MIDQMEGKIGQQDHAGRKLQVTQNGLHFGSP
jgi:hypothetical protein